jgi:hypothetical protein
MLEDDCGGLVTRFQANGGNPGLCRYRTLQCDDEVLDVERE